MNKPSDPDEQILLQALEASSGGLSAHALGNQFFPAYKQGTRYSKAAALLQKLAAAGLVTKQGKKWVLTSTPSSAPTGADACLSLADAAAQILEECANRRPLPYGEILQKAFALGIIPELGPLAEATLRAQIEVEIRRQQQRGERPRFVCLPGGRLGLARWRREDDLKARIERHNLEVRKQLHARLRQMDPFDFELLIGELLTKLGFEVEVTKPTGDGGIDVRGTLVIADVIRIRMAVQVKRWQKNVQKPTVNMVCGALGAHDQGLIITTSDFSPGARQVARQRDKKPVALMNGQELVQLLMEHQLGVRKSGPELFELMEEEAG